MNRVNAKVASDFQPHTQAGVDAGEYADWPFFHIVAPHKVWASVYCAAGAMCRPLEKSDGESARENQAIRCKSCGKRRLALPALLAT
jgi:hypothetical protein